VGVVTGLTAMVTVRHLRKRGQLLRAALVTGVASVVAAGAMGVLGRGVECGMVNQGWLGVGTEALLVMATTLVTALVVGGLLPVFEGVFRITTPLSWLELADLNHPLLRRMTMEAPGTYHHSLMVANLAEAAAEAVGADSTQCRVCSYFHDIGKLVKPEYCIENIGDENPHDDLAPSMSALVVMAQGRITHHGACADPQSHRALEQVFDKRIAIHAVQDQWVAIPTPSTTPNPL
jgi:putative nucleotidyltransferase with HDIG domain